MTNNRLLLLLALLFLLHSTASHAQVNKFHTWNLSVGAGEVGVARDAHGAVAHGARDAQRNQQAELERVNKLFDVELERLRRLWAGAPPGGRIWPFRPPRRRACGWRWPSGGRMRGWVCSWSFRNF